MENKYNFVDFWDVKKAKENRLKDSDAGNLKINGESLKRQENYLRSYNPILNFSNPAAARLYLVALMSSSCTAAPQARGRKRGTKHAPYFRICVSS
jgi:hypothetical protein